MDKSICGGQINQGSQSLNGDNQSNYKIPQSVKMTNEENNKNNSIDYKNFSFTMTGEISSNYIYRNSLTQKQPDITFIEDTEDDGEQFIANMQMIIDRNRKKQNKENLEIRDLQSKSYLSRKKKYLFSDEDQNLMKRFKSSVDKMSKASCSAARKSQQSEHVAPLSDHACSTMCAPQITSVVKYNNGNDTNSRSNMNEQFPRAASKNAQGWLTASCVAPKSQQPQHVASVSDHACSTMCAPQITSVVKYNNGNDMNSRSNMNEQFPHAASKNAQGWLTPEIMKTEVEIEIEIEQLTYYRGRNYLFTPPQKDNL